METRGKFKVEVTLEWGEFQMVDMGRKSYQIEGTTWTQRGTREKCRCI